MHVAALAGYMITSVIRNHQFYNFLNFFLPLLQEIILFYTVVNLNRLGVFEI